MLGGTDGLGAIDGTAVGPAAAGLQAAIATTASNEAAKMSFVIGVDSLVVDGSLGRHHR